MPLSKKQKRIARVSAPFNKISGADFRKLKQSKRKTKRETVTETRIIKKLETWF